MLIASEKKMYEMSYATQTLVPKTRNTFLARPEHVQNLISATDRSIQRLNNQCS